MTHNMKLTRPPSHSVSVKNKIKPRVAKLQPSKDNPRIIENINPCSCMTVSNEPRKIKR